MSDLGVAGSKTSASDSNWRKSAKSPTEKFGYILQHEQFSDVSFRVSENGKNAEIIKAHKLVLMTSSEVFERMFNGSFTESSHDSKSPIEVTDVDPSSFKTMFQFIYTGELPKKPSVSEAIQLINAAGKYDISDLEEFCWGYITKKLTINDSVTIFQAAKFYENKNLEDKAHTYIQENFDEVLECEDFLNFSVENLREFLTSDQIVVDTELEIFNGILRWSAFQCKEQNLTVSPANQQKVLGDLIRLINFTSISVVDIGSVVVPSEILTYKECTLLFQRSVVPMNQLEQLPKLPFNNVCRQRRTRIAKMVHDGRREAGDVSNKSFNFIFKVDKAIKIVGFGLTGHPDPTVQFIVSVRFVDTDTSAELSKITDKAVYSCEEILVVDLDNPLQIKAQQEYTISFMINGFPIRYYCGSRTVVTENGVIFTPRSGTDYITVPQIKFKLIP